jgi:1,2-diacylglycerol 3-beta-galactosyltransferase
VLLAGGGDGTEPLRPYARALAEMALDLQVLVVCGRNQWLARKIREDNHSGVYPYGFVDNMPELMLASDLLVTRAGPGMIAEGLACGCPLLLTGYLPGQEAGNVEAVVEGNLGRYVPKLGQLKTAVAEWFEQSIEVQEAARRRARLASSPEAAFDIARLIASLAG